MNNTKEVRMSAKGDKCKTCGGELKYNPYDKNIRCVRCENVYPFDKSKEVLQHGISGANDDRDYRAWLKQNKFLKCDSCGAQIMLDKYGVADVCPYCGNHYIATTESLPGLKPDAIIPFEFSEAEAVGRFKSAVRKKFFVPNDFKKNIPANKVYGVYVPAFSFDADSVTNYSGKLVDEGNSVTVVRNSEYGFESWNKVSGSVNCNHKNILVEASTKLTDYDLKNMQPFEFDGAYTYNQKFIVGYSVEYYQETINHCLNIAKNKMNKEIEYAINQKYRPDRVSDLSTDTTYSNQKYSYYLLPIYNLEYVYKGKKWITSMNGQTGKINDKLPLSKLKISFVTIFGIIIFLMFCWLFIGSYM